MARRRRNRYNRREETLKEWTPRTQLGKDVQSGKTSLDEIFQEGKIIKEPEIIDFLVPNLRSELILIGGSPGKGGGIRRTPTKRTTRMHRSGRRFKSSALVLVGNGDGFIGVGQGWSKDHRTSIEKAKRNAKLNVIPIRRGNGSWEDSGTEPNTVPFKIKGKSGSVETQLIPAPRGTGLAASDTVKTMLELAGINDIWVKTRGNTKTRENVIKSVYNAFKNANSMRTRKQDEEKVGMIIGYSDDAPDISSQYVIEGMDEEEEITEEDLEEMDEDSSQEEVIESEEASEDQEDLEDEEADNSDDEESEDEKAEEEEPEEDESEEDQEEDSSDEETQEESNEEEETDAEENDDEEVEIVNTEVEEEETEEDESEENDNEDEDEE